MIDSEMDVAEWTDVELKGTSHSEPTVFTNQLTDVEVKCTYHLGPEEDGTSFVAISLRQWFAGDGYRRLR
eukprot:6285806-Pyramimonas_sp.AAC.1